MSKCLFLFISLINAVFVSAQTTWSEEAAQVFYDKCAQCHNPGGVAPFALIEYEDAYEYRALIQTYVTYNLMPPWTPDPSFQHYFGERILSEYERETILNWALDGALEGDPTLTPPPPVFSSEQILPGTPDLVVEMPEYMSKATDTKDDYICISLPTSFIGDRKIKAVEVIPGNRSIVHHCLVYVDPMGTYPTDSTDGDCGGPSSPDQPLIMGYTPGSSPAVFPATEDFSTGMMLPEGSNIVFAMHYPHGSYGEYDQTKVNFYFYDEPVDNFREIFAAPVISNWEFELPPDEITEVTAAFSDIPVDITALSVFPHMHLLGNSIESFGLTTDGDTIPFIRIPHWDFDWQDFYFFEFFQKIPAGTDLIANGTYDNTATNPHNPSDPPVTVVPGFNTTDEMFLVYFHLMAYQDGDEFINLDSLNSVFLSNQENILPDQVGISVYPNPFDKSTMIEYNLLESSFVTIFIYDMSGKVVNRLFRGEQEQGTQQVVWNGTSIEGNQASSGLYNYSMLINGVHQSGRIIKQ